MWCILSEYHVIIYVSTLLFVLIALYTYGGQSSLSGSIIREYHASKHRTMVECVESDLSVGTATSGKVFSGAKVNQFNQSALLFRKVSMKDLTSFRYQTPISFLYGKSKTCDKWGVVTTINPPTAAIERQVRLHGWCLVIVADKNGPENFELSSQNTMPGATVGHFIYLSVTKQIEMEAELPMLKLLPWNSFGRKNVGYLYAIANGAKVIWDFDDDNMLISKHHVFQVPGLLIEQSNSTHVMMNHASGHLDGLGPNHDHTVFNAVEPQQFHDLVLNPFPLLGANVETAWPRGFPLERIKADSKQALTASLASGQPNIGTSTALATAPKTPAAISAQPPQPSSSSSLIETLPVKLKASEVGVIHYLANHEPDLDAVYKLTQPLPLDFPMRGVSPVVVPKGVYCPYNTQSSLILHNSFWSLLLPTSLYSRISDIYRGYVAQKISARYGLRLVIHPPIVTHVHTKRDIILDLHNETPLYLHVNQLLVQLQQWKPSGKTILSDIEELHVFLYEHGYLALQDVQLVQSWLVTLINLNYQLPEPV